MKKCPTCDKTYEDSMRFCQIDGTVLVDDAPSFDPYATIVGRAVPTPPQQDKPEAESKPQNEPENDVHMTVGSIPIAEPDDVLDLPSSDPLKTMYVSDSEMREALGKQDQSDLIEIPAIESEPAPPSFIAEEKEVPPAAPSSTGSPWSSFELEPPPIVSSAPPEPESPLTQERFDQPEPPPVVSSAPPPSPFDSADPGPVSSPFGDSRSSSDSPITAPPRYPDSEPARFDEAATMMQSDFDPKFEQPQQPAAWTPPEAPEREWQNQPLGAETPFQPPVAGADGANKTLAVVSLITGILGLTLCCGALLPSIAAIVTGVMARGKIKSNPTEYGGAGFATAGIVTGALGLIGGIIFLVVYFVVGLASLNLN